MKQSEKLTAKMVKLAEKSGVLDKVYSAEVNRLIRAKYSTSDEMAIHRHFLQGEKQAEFNEYNSFCEKCKEEARALIDKLLKS